MVRVFYNILDGRRESCYLLFDMELNELSTLPYSYSLHPIRERGFRRTTYDRLRYWPPQFMGLLADKANATQGYLGEWTNMCCCHFVHIVSSANNSVSHVGSIISRYSSSPILRCMR